MSTTRKRKQVASPTAAVTSPTSQNSRIFTESDELCLLQTFKKLTEQNPSSSTTPNSTITVDPATFSRINSTLGSKFTHTQITDKLRRLRRKFRNQNRNRSLIKTPHDQALFGIAHLIWGKKSNNKFPNFPSIDDGDEVEEENEEDVQNGEQERKGAVVLEKYPVLVGEFSKYMPMDLVLREALKSLGNEKLKEMNERWVMIGIEEAEIVIRKAELVKEQTQRIMDALGAGTANGYDYGGVL